MRLNQVVSILVTVPLIIWALDGAAQVTPRSATKKIPGKKPRPSPTATPRPSATATPTPTVTATRAPTPIPSVTPALTLTNERGLYYGFPFGDWPSTDSPLWANIGAFDGLRHLDTFTIMSKDAIKGVHGRLQHFGPRDTQSYFPWSEFVDYDNQQVAAGQPSMIVTATYQGKKRQLYFSYNNSVDPAFAFMAVNVRDERFIQFFYDMYWLGTVRVPGLNNQWLGLDNCAFSYANYGVVDDSGNWVNGVTWDPPYPQNDDEWVAAIVKILSELHAKDPSLRFIANGPDAATDAKFNQIAAQLDGFIYEDFLGDYNASPYGAQDLYKKFTRLQSVLFDKVQIYQPRGSDPAAVASAFLAYAIFTGPKGYYGMLDGQSVEADPSIWQPIRRALGQPTALGVADGQNGWRLYHREFEHGLAYFNWTGAAKTVTLPPGRTYFDKTGAKVTQLSLQYKEGAYVTF